MTRTVHAELTKLRTLRTTLGVVAATIAVAVLLSLGASSVAGDHDNAGLGDPQFVMNLLSGIRLALVPALVAGVLMATGEHHHATAAATFLVSPRRGRVVVAKALVAGMLGAGLAVLATVATLLVGAAVTAGQPVGLVERLAGPEYRVLAALVLQGAFLAVAGVAIGAVARNQVAALAVALGWSQLVETVAIPQFVPSLEPWTQDALFAAIAGVARPDLPAVGLALLLVVGYGVGLVAAGASATERVDLT